jgi:hypothetical protein
MAAARARLVMTKAARIVLDVVKAPATPPDASTGVGSGQEDDR